MARIHKHIENCSTSGGTSAHLEECTLKLPPEKCADFGGMYAQNRRNVRSPGGVYAQTAAVRSVPISEECTLKTGGTSAHLEECTLKPPTEVRRFRRNVRSKPEERPLTWRSVRSNRLRSAPISEECTLKTGGTSAHLEECTLKPPP
ncbi:hypothetical protein Bbelb_297670 [Branchiostoma belcheri]|nr:hypothetical protein Bbelb_297670 [Branchiostoma belcheri]